MIPGDEPEPSGLGEAEVIRSGGPLSVGAARNLGLAAVTTPYVVFLDADDELVPETQATMLALLDADDGAVAAISQVVDREGGEVVAPRRGVARLARVPLALALANATWSILPTQGCALIRADVARGCGGYADSDGGEDWAFGISLARCGADRDRARSRADLLVGAPRRGARHHGGAAGASPPRSRALAAVSRSRRVAPPAADRAGSARDRRGPPASRLPPPAAPASERWRASARGSSTAATTGRAA